MVTLEPQIEALAGFTPNGARAARLYARIVGDIADSVGRIVAGCPRDLALSEGIRRLPERIRAVERPTPEVACLYFDLVAATLDDNVDGVVALLGEMDRRLSPADAPFFQGWGEVPPETAERYLRHLNCDPATPVSFAVPNRDTLARAQMLGTAALTRMEEADPELAAEIRGLLTNVVFVEGAAGEGMLFDGATSFFCWGALFLNAAEHGSVVAMIDGLAHESGHALLFGMSKGDPFVTNPLSELHPSPLRRDPRPLDGIYHATFVSARMAYAMDKVGGAGLLTAEDQEEAEDVRRAARRAFWDGYTTLEAHATYTPLGADVMADARAYMDAHHPRPPAQA